MFAARARILCLAALVAPPFLGAENWPQFRGPNGNGLSTATEFPLEWGPEENIAWRTRVPGRGWSSPIVWGDRVFLTTAVMERKPALSERRVRGGLYRWEIHCLDLATGKLLWKQVAHQGEPANAIQQGNTYASETPVTDGERVYAYFGMTGLFAYDFNGKLVWKKDLGTYPMEADWGTGSSPVLHDGHLYLQIDSQSDSFLVALDPKTGRERWRVHRDEGSNWSSPFVWKNKNRTELITAGQTVRSYNPRSGELLWKMTIGGGRCSSSPSGDDELLYVGSEARHNGGGKLFAIRAGASGDITPEEGRTTSAGVVWSKANAAPPMASPLVYQGHVYVLKRRTGILTSYAAKTGEQAFRTRLNGAQGFWASPWASNGKVFILDDSGTTHVLEPGPDFKPVAMNSLDDQFWATPAVAGGALVLRGVEYVYCVRQ